MSDLLSLDQTTLFEQKTQGNRAVVQPNNTLGCKKANHLSEREIDLVVYSDNTLHYTDRSLQPLFLTEG
ncbi:MAG: hypothetical protein CMQ38_00150 [Gammaproteobacteria bacterium]|nr:hypothetical protein [Gammaproteobacteria bacterium]